jgi:hypothetical protein
MSVLTLKLEPELEKELETICHRKGYKKTDLVKTLIRNFLNKEGRGLKDLWSFNHSLIHAY